MKLALPPREILVPILFVSVMGLVALLFGDTSTAPAREGRTRVRVAYFPNLTHAPALIGVPNWSAAVPGIELEEKVVNAGPEAMEALLAGALDVCFVGPSPAINTFIKSKGEALTIVAGVCQNGASLMARKGSDIARLEDLDGKRLAIPQLGGTQDVSARSFLAESGLRPREQGGSVEILPIKNPDVIALFARGELDAAWVPEPWASRLGQEAGATRVLDERTLWPEGRFPTTVLVARNDFLREHRAIVERIVKLNAETIAQMRKDPDRAQAQANAELKRLTTKPLPPAVLAEAWNRLDFSPEIDRPGLQKMAEAAVRTGYLPNAQIEGIAR
jgi:NitT/TauT family transport system substrate-binding protein